MLLRLVHLNIEYMPRKNEKTFHMFSLQVPQLLVFLCPSSLLKSSSSIIVILWPFENHFILRIYLSLPLSKFPGFVVFQFRGSTSKEFVCTLFSFLLHILLYVDEGGVVFSFLGHFRFLGDYIAHMVLQEIYLLTHIRKKSY